MLQFHKTCLIGLLLLIATHSHTMEQETDVAHSAHTLSEAIKHNEVDHISRILKAAPQLLSTYSYHDGYNQEKILPLHAAAIYGTTDCLQLLLGCNNADVNAATVRGTTALHYVSSVTGARLLLAHKADLHKKNVSGKTPFFCSVIINEKLYPRRSHDQASYDLARVLLDAGAKINTYDNRRCTPLYRAVEEKNCNAVDFLLGKGADPDQKNKQLTTPFELALQYGDRNCSIIPIFAKYGKLFFPKDAPYFSNPFRFLRNQADWKQLVQQSNDTQLTEMLNGLGPLFIFSVRRDRFKNATHHYKTSHGILVNQHGWSTYGCIDREDLDIWFDQKMVDDIYNYIARDFWKAQEFIRDNDHRALETLIKKYPFLTLYLNNVLLVNAARLPEYQCLKVLFDNNIYCHNLISQGFSWGAYGAESIHGPTALHDAVNSDNAQAVELLLNHHVNLMAPDWNGTTPAQLAVQLKKDRCIALFNRIFLERLSKATINSYYNYEEFKQFLTQIPDVDARFSNGKPLLHCLVTHEGLRARNFVKLLIAAKANLNVEVDGMSAMSKATLNGSYNMCEMLLQAGARSNSNNDMYAPLNIALFHNQYDRVKLLLEYGAIVTEKNKNRQDLAENIQDLLCKAYAEQQCCICCEHPENLMDIPCKNRHINMFMCKNCDKIKHDKRCPYCNYDNQ